MMTLMSAAPGCCSRMGLMCRSDPSMPLQQGHLPHSSQLPSFVRPFRHNYRPLMRHSFGGRHISACKSRSRRDLSACCSLADRPHLQLATAKLPRDINKDLFGSRLYQWASTLTYASKNMPFALPFRTNPLQTGFEISLLRINDEGRPVSVGDITATVEPEPDVGDVLFVRFYEGEGSGMDRRRPPSSNVQQRLREAVNALVDIPIIMRSLPDAIRAAAKQSKTA